MLDYRTNTFLTLCECLNYRKTAERLNMTQPGVTQHIHALEKEYSCKLFAYDGRKLMLTREGQLFLEHLQKARYDDAWLRDSLRHTPTPSLHIGATKSIGDYMISNQIVALLRTGEFRVDLTVENTKILLEKIKSGILDFAMIEGDFDKASFGHRKMRSEPFVGVCSVKSSLANKSLELSALFDQYLLLREMGSGTRAIFEDQLAFHGESIAAFKNVNSISSFALIKDIVAHGNAISFGYKSVFENDERLALFEVRDFFPYHDLYYVYQANSHAQTLLDKYIEITK